MAPIWAEALSKRSDPRLMGRVRRRPDGRDPTTKGKEVRIGVLTGGGDCPGLNAVIRAVVRTSDSR
ncbi:6-phosphofructokinase, partial [Tsukamurella tyrosinosolvens]|uniref:6-phosphofructokinase n=1 Tax=Tsukamurella tyrosinosolvens TaxID=57704 RepID=UPI003B968E55